MNDKVLNQYFEKIINSESNSQSLKAFPENLETNSSYHIHKSLFSTSVTYDQFINAFKSILSCQSEYFRAIYNNLESSVDISKMIEDTKTIIRDLFDKYDVNCNGYIERNELERLFEDLGLKEMYKDNFREFIDQQFDIYDRNYDGVISYEEFIHIHNNLLDDIKGTEMPGHMSMDTI